MKAYVPTMLALFLLCSLLPGCGRGERAEREKVFSSENAARIVELYLTGDWVAAQALVDSIGLSSAGVVEAMRAREMTQSARDLYRYLVYRLTALSRDRADPVQAALVANQISAVLIDLEAGEDRGYPEALDRMAYLGREIILLAQSQGDYGLMNARLAQLERTWVDFRPEILKRNAESLAAQVDQVIADLRERGPDVRMINGGNRILDLVREMRVLYK